MSCGTRSSPLSASAIIPDRGRCEGQVENIRDPRLSTVLEKRFEDVSFERRRSAAASGSWSTPPYVEAELADRPEYDLSKYVL
jgi:ATP-dependent protease HslVU (ClpYQ) ATPase subunit